MNLARLISVFLLLSLLSSCVSVKKKGEAKGTKKFYHNTTAYYNAYFNANLLMEEAMFNMQEANLDNYSQILSVYDYVNLQNPKSEAPNLDKAVEKVSKSAALHRQSHWVDDCYVVIGKAQFYKQDYETAEETFLFFEDEFDPKNPYGSTYEFQGDKSDIQKRRERKQREKQREFDKKVKEAEKKERDKEKKEVAKERKELQKQREKDRKQAIKDRKKGIRPSSSSSTKQTAEGETQSSSDTQSASKEDSKAKDKDKEEDNKDNKFKHEPAYYEGVYWLGRTLTERENYSSAEYYFNKVVGSEAVEDVRNEIPAARANLYLKRKDYDEALSFLEEAIGVTKNKTQKARYAFIKAQIYDRLGNPSSAFKEFARCKEFKPTFEMEFYADLNDIRLSKEVGKLTSAKAIAKLEKMLNDEKYSEYSGAVYQAIGDVQLSDNDVEGALASYKKAAQGGLSGGQEVESYYKLASLYYDNEEYAKAKEYYDLALDKMPKNDERYKTVKKLAGSLSEIARAINTIELQDSLIALTLLSDDELREIAANQRGVDDKTRGASLNEPENTFNRRFGSGRSNFFAYNPLVLNQGKQEFQRLWGDVVLEDDWRRSSRADASTASIGIDVGGAEVDNDISDVDFEKFKQSLPFSKIDKDLANRKVQESMLSLGTLYRDKLENYSKSAEVLESLLSKFPTIEEKDKVYFYLYLDYRDLNDSQQANRYKQLLIDQFPNSEFTKIASDPNYAKQVMAEENKLVNYYDKTYNLFEQDAFGQVVERVSEAEGLFGDANEYQAKFDLLKAMSIGNIDGQEGYIAALEALTKKHPNTAESTRAKEILRFLKGDGEAFDAVIFEEASQAFEVEETALHYIAVVTYGLSDAEVDQAKLNVSAFNREFYRNDRLQQVDIFLNKDNESQIILIRKFDSSGKAMDYYNTVQKTKDQFIQNFDYEIYAVSQRNYREIIKQRSVNSYRAFFEKEYLEN